MKKSGLHDESPAQEDDNFLRRWSRKKQEFHVQESLPGGLADKGTEESSTGDRVDTNSPTRLGDEDMPPLETLTEDSDYSCFFSPDVSDDLRTRALRILFSSPGFNVCDGLDDYDEDFTSFEKLGDIITADMRHQLDRLTNEASKALDEPAVTAPESRVADSGPSAEPETAAPHETIADTSSEAGPILEANDTEKT